VLTGRLWLLYLRGRKVHLVVVMVAVSAALSLTLPPVAPVALREVVTDPRVAAWGLPACVLPTCLHSAADAMESRSSRPVASRHLVVVFVSLAACLTGVTVASWTTGLGWRAPSFVVIATFTIAMALTLLFGSIGAQVVMFAAVMGSWVFGPDVTGSPRPWALLLGSDAWVSRELAALALLVCSPAYAWRGDWWPARR